MRASFGGKEDAAVMEAAAPRSVPRRSLTGGRAAGLRLAAFLRGRGAGSLPTATLGVGLAGGLGAGLGGLGTGRAFLAAGALRLAARRFRLRMAATGVFGAAGP